MQALYFGRAGLTLNRLTKVARPTMLDLLMEDAQEIDGEESLVEMGSKREKRRAARLAAMDPEKVEAKKAHYAKKGWSYGEPSASDSESAFEELMDEDDVYELNL